MTERYSRESSITGRADVFTGSVHWPSVLVGLFIALSLFVFSTILAWAVGINFTFHTAVNGGQETAAVIWGLITAIVCFGIGGLFAARLAGTRGSGLLNGMMVFAVALPVMFYFMGSSADPMLGRQVGDRAGVEAMQAAARIESSDMRDVTIAGRHTVGHYQVAAWWTLASLVLGAIAAAGAGYLAADADVTGPRVRTTTET